MDAQAFLVWLQAQPEIAVAFGSAVVSVFAAFFSARETGKQRRIQMESLRTEVDKASLVWGQSAIDVMGQAASLASDRETHLGDTAFKAKRADIANQLSAIADRGRLFFPNIDPQSKGAEKEGAFKGSRPPILDALIYAFYEVEGLGTQGGPTADDSCQFIMQCRRLLVSELQAHLDPRRRDEVVGRYGHRRQGQRIEALEQAGRLGVRLDARRPGTLAGHGDGGWIDLISPDERRAILHDIQSRDVKEAAE